MEPITLTVSNELAALAVLQAAAEAFLRTVGAEDGLSCQIKLVLEEIFTNILDHGYLSGQRERIQMTLGIDNRFLVITMRFKGIPFDVDYLQKCADYDPKDILDGCVRGIGLRLIKQFSDRIEYRNLGKEGQEICLLREISTRGASRLELACAEETCKWESKSFNVSLRRMLPSEAATVSKLAYFAYNYSYVYGHIYDPEKVRSLNEENQLISFVAVHEEDGIIGHFAISPDDKSDLFEMCAGFVDARFRGNGSMNAMAAHGINEAKKLGAEGVFVIAVTTHPYSQKAALSKGLRETALFVSCVQPLAMRAIREEALARESVFFMTCLFGEKLRGPYHSPAHHRVMLEQICRNAELEAAFGDWRGEIPLPEHGQLEQKTDDYQAGHIFVHGYGRDTASQVRRSLRLWQIERLETIFLYLPLLQPPTAVLCESFEEMGFFFSGLRPSRRGQDWLVLQFLNNQCYDYGQLKAATAFGQEMIDYVRERDPVRSI
jgi:anti-sigma regulatory factor (Ser/Thr protein kinase)